MQRLHIALLHWPVVNRNGDTVATATTNLDIHDIARLSITYGVQTYWIVQPLDNQRAMIQRIVDHWVDGPARDVHPNRSDALQTIRVVRDLTEVAAELERPYWVATSAIDRPGTAPVSALAAHMTTEPDRDVVLCFGTGWGMSEQVVAAADMLLEPIAPTDYNHLSVRSAVSIYLDRIWQALQS